MAETFDVDTRVALHGLAAEIKMLRLQQVALIEQLAGERIPSYLGTPRVASRATLTDTVTEFERLLERRDLAAYRVVAALQLVIDFLEAQDYDGMYVQLCQALDDFQAADQRITEFHKHHQGEHYGNRTA